MLHFYRSYNLDCKYCGALNVEYWIVILMAVLVPIVLMFISPWFSLCVSTMRTIRVRHRVILNLHHVDDVAMPL
jgi:hypothetical protein